MDIKNMRTLAALGFPAYFIDIYGNLINILTKNIIQTTTAKRGLECKILCDYQKNMIQTMQVKYLVAEAWYLEPEELWKNSPYYEYIARYKEFFWILPSEKRYTGYSNSYGGNFWVTRWGDIWEDRFRRKLKFKITKGGYYRVNLKPVRDLMVHRLVAKAFVPIRERLLKQGYTYDTLQVNHIDGNKLNNNITNLEWCTGNENMRHASENNLMQVSISDETLNQIADDLASGLTDTVIGHKYNIAAAIINTIRTRKIPRYQRLPQKWSLNEFFITQEQKQEIISMFLNGSSIRYISQKTKRSIESIYDLIKRRTHREFSEPYKEQLRKEFQNRGWELPNTF